MENRRFRTVTAAHENKPIYAYIEYEDVPESMASLLRGLNCSFRYGSWVEPDALHQRIRETHEQNV